MKTTMQGCNTYFNRFSAASKLDPDWAWYASFFRLRETNRPLADIDPRQAVMQAIRLPNQSDLGFQFWPPAARRGRGSKNNNDNDDDDPHDADDELDDEGASDDDDTLANRREVMALLDENLHALRKASKASQPSGVGGSEGDGGASSASDDPGSDSDSSSTSSSSISLSPLRPSEAGAASEHEGDDVVRGSADAACKVPYGTIRFYKNKGAFTAECSCHGSCVKTRQSTASKSMAHAKNPSPNIRAKGRPLGYLVAWLAGAHNASNKEEHWAAANQPSFEARKDARARLAIYANGNSLLEHERPKHDGEDDEPEGIP
jgi:hypothetical protein